MDLDALHDAADRFDYHARLWLPVVTIAVALLPAKTLGLYRPAQRLVVMNALHRHRPPADRARTLFHELVHMHLHLWHGVGGHGPEFRAKMARHGVLSSADGVDELTPAFLRFLADCGIRP